MHMEWQGEKKGKGVTEIWKLRTLTGYTGNGNGGNAWNVWEH